jgi:hypothetical protein
MYRTGLFWRFILALLLVGLLAAGGVALFRAGWAQGYQAGALSVAPGSGVGGTTPGVPFYPYLPYGFYPFFPPFGIFAWIGGFFLLFFLFGGLFRLWGWRHWAGGPGYGPWGRHPGKEPAAPERDKPSGAAAADE